MPEYMTTAELADLCRTSVETVRYWRHKGKGPVGVKVGRRVLYEREAVHAWLNIPVVDQVVVIFTRNEIGELVEYVNRHGLRLTFVGDHGAVDPETAQWATDLRPPDDVYRTSNLGTRRILFGYERRDGEPEFLYALCDRV